MLPAYFSLKFFPPYQLICFFSPPFTKRLLPLQKTDVIYELVEELQVKAKEFLQPNPTARAKMAAVKGISKMSGQAKAQTYPQPEGIFGECLSMYGKKLGDDSIFGTLTFLNSTTTNLNTFF